MCIYTVWSVSEITSTNHGAIPNKKLSRKVLSILQFSEFFFLIFCLIKNFKLNLKMYKTTYDVFKSILFLLITF